MVRISSFMWLITASSVLFSLMYINAGNENRIQEVTVRSLKFLAAYQANVAAHREGPVDEEQKEHFLEGWKGSYFMPEETLTKLYNSVEKDWRYALDLASSNENNLSALVVALNTKIEAYLQSSYYMPCFTLPVNSEHYHSNQCQNLAANLLILSYIGTDQLIEKFVSIAGPVLSPDNYIGIKLFQKVLAKYYNTHQRHMREKKQRLSNEDNMSDDSLNEYLHAVANNEPLLTLNRLSSRMMFGKIPIMVQQDKFHWYDAECVKFMWQKAKDINEHLTELSEGDNNYDITCAMHEIIMQRAEFWKLSTRDVANKLNEIKLRNVEIRVNDREFLVNLN